MLATPFDETLGNSAARLERTRFFHQRRSHELRTPLMIIASFCRIALKPLAERT